MPAYYNEIDAYCVRWLSNLIAADLIAPGDVDDRPIQEVQPEDLRGYTQCHFFAGLGGWSYAARLAGWPDERGLWTGSCPCQPFSVAGKGLGEADPRHLWPYFFPLIRAGRPLVLMGEQTAAQAGYDWFDGVASDLESEGFQTRAIDIPSASVGAPHKRNRLYWVADTSRIPERKPKYAQCPESRQDPRPDISGIGGGSLRLDDSAVSRLGQAGPEAPRQIRDEARWAEPERRSGVSLDCGGACCRRCRHDERWHDRQYGCGECQCERFEDGRGLDRMGDPYGSERRTNAEGRRDVDDGADPGRKETPGGSELASANGGMANPYGSGCDGARIRILSRRSREAILDPSRPSGNPWAEYELIGPDPEGKHRRIKPGLTPMVTRLPGHIQQIRAYGNAITPWLAAEVIAAYMETR